MKADLGAKQQITAELDRLKRVVSMWDEPTQILVEDIIDLPAATAEDTRKRMFALMGELGITDREVSIECIGELIRNRELKSRTELGPRDWFRVVQAIEDWKIIESYTPSRPA